VEPAFRLLNMAAAPHTRSTAGIATNLTNLPSAGVAATPGDHAPHPSQALGPCSRTKQAVGYSPKHPGLTEHLLTPGR
jgi:hypothetical protein